MPPSLSSGSSVVGGGGRIPLLALRTWQTDPSLFVTQLRDAARTVGFFLLRHDLPPGVATSVLDESRQFFARSREEKETIGYEESGGTFRGYVRLGAENTAGRVDLREQVEYGTEAALSSRHGRRKRLWPPYERLRGPNPWPDAVQPTLRPAVERYVDGVGDIAAALRAALCVGLGEDARALDETFGEGEGGGGMGGPYWQLKLVSYPASSAAAAEDGGDGDGDEELSRQGVGAHTDSNFLTLVLQDDAWDSGGTGGNSSDDDNFGGLQVYSSADDDWIDVPSDLGPDVLVCNIGEQAEILSGGYYRATPHRVVVPRRSDKSRTSVPFFYNPDLSARLEALPSRAREEGTTTSSSNTGPDSSGDGGQWRKGENRMLGTVGENLFKSLARSHPAVFRRYHGDLRVLDDGRIVSVDDAGREE